MAFSYAEQAEPRGLADAFLVGRNFVGTEPACLILGDNIFYGQGLPGILRESAALPDGALIFAYAVSDPTRYGIVEFDKNGCALSLEEKPLKPRSNYAVPGLYFFDGNVVEYASSLKPSARGELEITDLNLIYLAKGQLRVRALGRGVAWLDAGTHESLQQSANFVQAVEERQGLMISCPEEIAFRMGYIDRQKLLAMAQELSGNGYGEYLLKLAQNEESI
jgi:glucose-1-phosphate thymidylyltransferase